MLNADTAPLCDNANSQGNLFIVAFIFFFAELLEREPQILGEVLPERLHRRPPRQRDAGHEAHLHRHQIVAPPVRDARQEVAGLNVNVDKCDDVKYRRLRTTFLRVSVDSNSHDEKVVY